jgi:xanthine dehydrogenase accessory factor
MASGVISILFRADYEVIALERPTPLCVRRAVCFAEAVFAGVQTVEGITAVRAATAAEITGVLTAKKIPVLIDPDAESAPLLAPRILVDGRMLKTTSDCSQNMARIVIGLGPGFIAGDNCHAAVETNRGDDLGRIYHTGGPQGYTGIPAAVDGITTRRVMRAAADGIFTTGRRIGEPVVPGERIGQIGAIAVQCPLAGVLRGLLRDGDPVTRGRKVGDIDPRGDPERCFYISRKAATIGQGVLDAIRQLDQSAPR